MRIPTEEDWGDLERYANAAGFSFRERLDLGYAHDKFLGRSREDMEPAFEASVISCFEDLCVMPAIPFAYYVIGFRDYVLHRAMQADPEPDDGNPDAASTFMTLVLQRLERDPEVVMPVIDELMPALEHVARNQLLYGASPSIYGGFPEKLSRIEALVRARKGEHRG